MESKKAKRIPYGTSNFVDIVKGNQYYVDKTMYIPKLEDQPDNLIFIRPRRFGKSLLISMLCCYYDIAQKDNFQELFGNLWIGQNPTELQGKFQVLCFDFSQVGGDIEHLSERFNNYCNRILDSFMDNYKSYYSDIIQDRFYKSSFFGDKLTVLTKEAAQNRIPLYLIIDEYDNFTNVVLNEKGEKVYHDMTHASGFYRDAFKKFKGTFTRILLIGVSPVTLDDVTSGFNIGWNISTSETFNKLLGFCETDVRDMITYYKEAGALSADTDVNKMIADMKPWYDNYCFSEGCLGKDAKIFNSDMVLYYMRYYLETGHTPKSMIDPNTRTDYNKMKKLLDLDHLDERRKSIIRQIAQDGQIISTLNMSFPATDMINPDNFVSLLFYYGMLTITGSRGERMILSIPNNNVRKQYYDYLLEMYQTQKNDSIVLSPLQDAFDTMAFDGNAMPAMRHISRLYAENSSVRSSIEGERNIQGFFMALLSVSAYFLTAPEVELNHGFCDFFMMPDLVRYPEVKHSYIIELKYLSAKDFVSKADAQWTDAITQINSYAQGPKVLSLCQGTQLHKIIMQFKSWECVRMEEV